MAKFNAQKQWWQVVIAVGLVGVAAMVITDQWLPAYRLAGSFLMLGLIGASFCWAYAINRERQWWAIIPGLGAFTLLAALLADSLVGTDPANDWVSVLVIGIGAVIIAALLKHWNARYVLVIVAVITFFVGILMMPVTPLVKGIMIAVEFLMAAFYFWRTRKALPGVG
jgi:hypothetical protein